MTQRRNWRDEARCADFLPPRRDLTDWWLRVWQSEWRAMRVTCITGIRRREGGVGDTGGDEGGTGIEEAGQQEGGRWRGTGRVESGGWRNWGLGGLGPEGRQLGSSRQRDAS
eukprot:2807236-Pleurochrysis_carterae.AAC.2